VYWEPKFVPIVCVGSCPWPPHGVPPELPDTLDFPTATHILYSLTNTPCRGDQRFRAHEYIDTLVLFNSTGRISATIMATPKHHPETVSSVKSDAVQYENIPYSSAEDRLSAWQCMKSNPKITMWTLYANGEFPIHLQNGRHLK
jgi:hypothetical protein